MKILMVNKFYYIKGGSETYYFNIKKMLQEHGHEVIDFSMKDEKNFYSKYSKYFVENVDYNKKMSMLNKIKCAIKIIYNREAKKKFEKLIKTTQPDIIHLNIFQHQISSSIINVALKYNIPMVYTAHDLQALCPNYKMMDNDYNVCEKCKGNRYFYCVKKKCVKKSYLKSFISYVDAKYNKLNRTYDKLAHIITPSAFYKQKFIEYGYNPNKITHIPNFIDFENKISKNKNIENYFLYFGRLSEEKGILTLIEAAKKANVKLKIVGSGPLLENIEKKIKEEKISNIELLGFKTGEELYSIIYNSKCVVLPSEWYENGPYSAIESLALSRPIIGSDLGGIPELIEPGKNGFIFKHSNVNDLADKIDKVNKLTPKEIQAFENYSQNIYIDKYLSKYYYKALYKIYNDALEKK